MTAPSGKGLPAPDPLRKPLRADVPSGLAPDGVRTLYPSLQAFASRAGLLAVAFVGAYFRAGLWFVYALAVLLLLICLVTGRRRVQLDRDGVTVVPLLPLRPRHFPWSSLGPFAQKRVRGVTTFKAPALDPSAVSAARLFPRSGLTLQAVYGPGWLAAALPPAELGLLLESYRSGTRSALPKPLPRFGGS
ncbi:MAG TPA: hypothetical protein VH063_07290 [Gaiellaceae bacterium]|nr:hypothetical protein [Gaiellaceae bacterium]